MATLYEIDNEILNCIDEETGEIIDEERLNTLNMERNQKIENVALWYKNLISDAEAYKHEKDVFIAKQKAAENKAEQLKEYLKKAIQGEKFTTTKVAISWRKSEAVEVKDWTQLEEEYLRYKEPEVDKVKLKKALKNGELIYGAILLEKQNIQIK